MLKDIERPKVEEVAVAVVPEISDQPETKGEKVYNTYLINHSEELLEGVLVSSKGYKKDQSTGEVTKTSMLRHFLDTIEAKSYAKIEPIIEEVFHLNNEYWVSYYLDGKMYDKKFVFLSETIKEDNFIKVPIINKKGVVIK